MFLDATDVRKDDPATIKLHEILIRAYPDKVGALAIAGQVGILQADISVHPKMRYTWWSILEEAARERQLRRLVETALRDPTIAGWHDAMRACVASANDRVSTTNVERPAEETPHERGRHPTVGDVAPLWKPGQTLRIRFLDGDAKVHDSVQQAVSDWVDYANIHLDFGDDPESEIRISFQPGGSWAYVGKNCLLLPQGKPNVSFGWLKADTSESEIRRVVLHEFGHVLGLQHEQGNPDSNIEWNKEEVYMDLSGPPNFWAREQVDHVYFAIWPPGHYPVRKIFDPNSIMILPIPETYLRCGTAIGWNTELSPLDKQFIAALYPYRSS